MLRTLRPLSLALSLSLLPASGPLLAAESADAAAAPAPSAAASRPAQAERSEDASTALAEQLPAEEQQLLQAADESFLALWLPANAPRPHGVVILLGGDGESPDWPTSLGPWRRKLPDAGWHSLALGLPDPLDSRPQPRPLDKPMATAEAPATGEAAAATTTVAADTGEMAATEAQPAQDPAARHARRIEQRIAAALELARRQQATRIVLLGHGSGAYWGARYLAQEQPADVQHLLLVAVEQPADASPALDELLAGLKLATGDFYYNDSHAARQAASARARTSKRQAHPAYTQVALQALPGNRALEHEQLLRRLRGWLDVQAKQ